jgi:restriction system protein
MPPIDDDPPYPLWLQGTSRATPARLTGILSFREQFDDQVPALEPPAVLLQAVIVPGSKQAEGHLVQAVAIPWYQILTLIAEKPETIYQIDWRKWEEIIAGAYKREGYDVVITPRSNDGGRDIIATRSGLGSIRILDQVKAYAPGHLVDAGEVRAMLGVLTAEPNVSKGFVTTTSDFAPGIYLDSKLTQFIPYRLELRARPQLLEWLNRLAAGGNSAS